MDKTLDMLLLKAKEIGISIHNRDMVYGCDVLKFVDLCTEMSIGILGFDGFELNGSKRIPRSDLILDLSSIYTHDQEWGYIVNSANDICRNILKQTTLRLDENVVFEFVIQASP